MPNDVPLFKRLPDEAVGPVFELLRERCEGGADYQPPDAVPDNMQAVRGYLKRLSSAELERAYAQFRKRMPTLSGRSADPMRGMAVGGQHPHAAQMNRFMRSIGR